MQLIYLIDDINATSYNFREIVEAHFLSCIKEADVLKHRGQIVSSMQKKDHTQLWNGIMNDKFDQFWSVNGRLMEATTEEGFKYIPFRCYTNEDKYIQRLVKPMNEEGQRKTLKHLLSEVFPDQENGTRVSNKKYVTTIQEIDLILLKIYC